MKVIHTSRLSEVKSVFNSEADNVQYYNVLKNSNCLKFYNVELAKPIVRKSKGEIIWQSDTVLELKSLSELPENQRIKYGEHLEKFFKNFQTRVSRFSNISKDFAKNVMEIPDWNSVLVNEDQDYIVIVNWGFLEDKFNRKEGIIETLFPIPDQSILVRLINENDEPIVNQNIDLVISDTQRSDYTNSNGYARFGTLIRGKSFNIKFNHKASGKLYAFDFVCDGRQEYVVQIKEKVLIKIIVKDRNGSPLENTDFFVNTPILNDEKFNTRQLGHFKFNHKVSNDFFEIKDEENKILLREKIPFEDSTFIIECDDNQDSKEEAIGHIEYVEQKDDNVKFIFVNAFKKPLKGLSVDFNCKGNSYKRSTNNRGEVVLALNNDTSDQLDFSFRRYREFWDGSLDLSPGVNNYVIKSKPLFPWLWWLLILILFILLWCCAIGDCFCNELSNTNPNANNYSKPIQDDEDVLVSACDIQTNSGGHGITKTKHVLGDDSGEVELLYNMENIPDKLEVFYQGKLLTSTFEISGNKNGYVGGRLSSGPKARLRFKYNKDMDDFVTVVVTGYDENTSWEYLISCPK
ncbi:hypothetical protein EVU94_13965 [Flavobacteriaceae bacterium 144Ye]|nr:hypothetical protein EVU94_13965 [Flavobacteriaceae bacterium 144Ye]